MGEIKVSVALIAYNQENYIKECLESAINQKVNFGYEIVIGQDCSTDRTHEICLQYANLYPHIIKYNPRLNNLGMMGNWIKTIDECQGKYIAICEGDDYWTDNFKLQKQVDFLEQNESYSACFHPVNCLVEGEFYEDSDIEKRYQQISDKNVIKAIDLLKQGNFIYTCSVVFRSKLIEMPFEANYSSVADYILFISLAKKGSLKRLDEKMAVYRRGVGIYSSLDSYEMTKKMLNYQICVLSFLTDEDERKIMLEKIFLHLGFITKQSNLSNFEIANKTTFAELFKIFNIKLRRLIGNKFKLFNN